MAVLSEYCIEAPGEPSKRVPQNGCLGRVLSPPPHPNRWLGTGSLDSVLLPLPLQKAAGYHLDLFWVGILMALCSFMGLPWYVAATVISIAHIDSLRMETETSAPGEQPQFLGVR